tara:strand:- start:44 stop:679 length:636 start_codon:yes stop_codon:yes gene_type:complete
MFSRLGMTQEHKFASGNTVIYFGYGYHTPTINNSNFSEFNWKIPVVSIGISGTIPIESGSAKKGSFSTLFDTYAQFSMFLKTKVDIANSQANVSGYKIHIYNFGKDIIPEMKNFDLLLGIGFSFGRYSLLFNNSELFTNPFIGIGLNIEPRLFIKNISIGLKTGYDFDFSKKSWISKQETSTIELNNFSASRFNLQLMLGLRINKTVPNKT